MKLNPDGLIVMRMVDLAGKAPNEIPILPVGKWDGYVHPVLGQKTLEVTLADLQAAAEHQVERKQRGPRELVIDYEHQTFKGGEAPAAGWIPDLEVRDTMLWATNVRWTPKAKQRIEDGEYRYVSPAFGQNVIDKLTGKKVRMAVTNVALTNEPFLDELPPLVAKGSQEHLYIFNTPYHHQTEEHMNELLLLLTAFFSLAATAKPEEIVAKVNWLTEQLKAAGVVPKEGTVLTAQLVIDQLKLIAADATTFKANYIVVAKALGGTDKSTIEELKVILNEKTDRTGFVAKTEFDALQLKVRQQEVDALMGTAIQFGKLTKTHPFYEDYVALGLKDPTALKTRLDKIAEYSFVPLQKIETATEIALKGTSPSDVDLAIAKQLNVTVDQLKKVTTN
jgi:phage I-like protein